MLQVDKCSAVREGRSSSWKKVDNDLEDMLGLFVRERVIKRDAFRHSMMAGR
jgi:hypothetical protein